MVNCSGCLFNSSITCLFRLDCAMFGCARMTNVFMMISFLPEVVCGVMFPSF